MNNGFKNNVCYLNNHFKARLPVSSASNFIIVLMQMVRLTDRMGAEPFCRSNEVSSFTQCKFDGDVTDTIRVDRS